MANWFQDSYKNLFFDFHTHSSATGVAEGFDADSWAEGINEFGVQAVSAFAVDAFGWRWYQKGDKGWVHPALPTGLDLLGDIIDACHKRDLKVIGYFNTMNSEPVAAHHPQYVELDIHGRPKSDYEIFDGIAICWMSPAFEEIFLPQVAEIAANYDLDALFFDGTYSHSPCYCSSCHERYLEEKGRDLPTDPEDRVSWSEYVVWAEGRFDVIRERIIETVVSTSPQTLVCVNWYTANRRPAIGRHPENMFFNLDLHPETQLFDASYQARSWSSQETPWTCQNTGFLDWWGDWGVKHPVALKQECASIMSSGGRLFTGYQMYPDLSIHPGLASALDEMLAFVDQRLPAVVGTNARAEIAVLHPTTSYIAKDPELFTSEEEAVRVPVGAYGLGFPEIFADEAAVRGAHRMLLELGYDYQIVTEEALNDNLDSYRVVVLPGERYVTEELIERLAAFAERGGVVIASFEPTRISDELEAAWSTFLGVQRDGVYEFSHAYVAEDAGGGRSADPFMVRSAFSLAKPTEPARSLAAHQDIYLRSDGRPLLKTSPPGDLSGYSAVTRRDVGEGSVVSFNFEPFSAYLKTNQWRLKELFARVLADTYAAPIVRVDAPGTVEVTLRDGDGFQVVHLTNHNGYRSVQEGTWAMNDAVLPVHDAVVSLRVEGDVVVSDGESGDELPVSAAGEIVSVTVPRLDIHTWLEVRRAG